MAAEKKKKYDNMRIMAIEGKDLYRAEALTALKNGKLTPEAFDGIIDESLDTDKLCEVYKAHEAEMGYPYLADKKYCSAIVSVSFDYAVKLFEQYGRRFVRYGYTVTDADMVDHACVREVDGTEMLVAIEIPYENDKTYAPVESPLYTELIGKYFDYDAEKKEYKRSKRDIPSAVKCEEIREQLYSGGFDIDGIHYVRYKRSAGSSRDGRCLFIAEPLYQDMMDWSSCGLSADSVSDQASWQAYIALTLSSIESAIRLPKKSILIIPDKVSKFKTTAVCVKEDATVGLTAEEEETEIENVIWDGEALLDVSEFERAGYADKGMMLLRNRFFKTCAFNTNLQKWFKDNGITTVGQLAGYTTARKVEDIKLVITESSLKYLKFMPKDMSLGEAFKSWLDAVYEGKTTSTFGVVKTDKKPLHMFGNMVYTNYQLINTVNAAPEQIARFVAPTLDYLGKIQSDPMFLRYYAKVVSYDHITGGLAPLNVENYRHRVIMDMMARTEDFQRTDFYKSYRDELCRSFKERMKKGRILVEGNYQTIFGNPYEFLYATVHKDYEPTESLLFEENEAYTNRFDDGEWLLCARSPHITMGNLYIVQNQGYEEIDEYFNLTSAIVCVNAIGSNIQQRLNGCDYDSDTMLVTPNKLLCDPANEEYYHYGVPVCKVALSGKTDYENSPRGLAKLDRVIANNLIGEIVNLSQFLNSLYWNEIAYGRTMDEVKWIYLDVCKLAVLSGMEIDKAKRMYAVDAGKVLRILKKPRDAYKKNNGGKLPEFFRFITEGEAPETDGSVTLNTPMSFLYDIVEGYKSKVRKTKNVPLTDLFELDAKDSGANDTHKKQNIIKIVSEAEKAIRTLMMKAKKAEDGDRAIYVEKAQEIFERTLSAVSKNIVNDHILCLLLKELDKKKDSSVSRFRHLLFACLVYEDGRRLLSKVKGVRDYIYSELVLWNDDPDEAWNLITENILGYLHVIIDNSQNTEQLKEKFYSK
ncbi:MAG: hypothetical protein J6A83_08710 [Clostridia bacterium]|nr:hypothetical protein [Clostridia bacterium]